VIRRASPGPGRPSRILPVRLPAAYRSIDDSEAGEQRDSRPARGTASSWAQRPPALAPTQRGRDDLYSLSDTRGPDGPRHRATHLIYAAAIHHRCGPAGTATRSTDPPDPASVIS
jgi:hypothetical protein